MKINCHFPGIDARECNFWVIRTLVNLSSSLDYCLRTGPRVHLYFHHVHSACVWHMVRLINTGRPERRKKENREKGKQEGNLSLPPAVGSSPMSPNISVLFFFNEPSDPRAGPCLAQSSCFTKYVLDCAVNTFERTAALLSSPPPPSLQTEHGHAEPHARTLEP